MSALRWSVPRRSALAAAVLVALLAAGCGSSGAPRATPRSTVAPPVAATPSLPPVSRASPNAPSGSPDHVVVVVFENKAYDQIAGSDAAPYFNQLAATGVRFERFTAVTHPSEPNYLALFSGSTQGLRSDHCPLTFPGQA